MSSSYLRLHLLLPSIIVVCILESCVRDSATSPTRPPLSGGGAHPAYNQGVNDDSDPCTDVGDYPSCHADSLSYENIETDVACPQGCHTFSLLPQDVDQINSAIGLIPNNDACGWAITYMRQMLLHGRIRTYYEDDDANADTHPSKDWDTDGTPDMAASIHLWVPRVEMQTTKQLANTLVHEAWHGYFSSHDETAAQGEADACIPGGFP